MQYCELMFSKNASNGQYDGRIKSRLSFRDKRLYYKISAELFTGDQIYEMIEVMNYIWRIYNQKIPITFDLGEFEFYDKLVYVILESLCYYLLKEKGHSIKILFNAKHTIWSEGICYSPLKNIGDKDKFIQKYESDLRMYHFRRLVPNKENRNEQYHLANLQENYKEQDFYTISSFQHKISGQLFQKMFHLARVKPIIGNVQIVDILGLQKYLLGKTGMVAQNVINEIKEILPI